MNTAQVRTLNVSNDHFDWELWVLEVKNSGYGI